MARGGGDRIGTQADEGGGTLKTLSALKTEILADPAVRREYEAQAPEYDIARAVVQARIASGPTRPRNSGDARPRPPHTR